jgi:hypothetical protein
VELLPPNRYILYLDNLFVSRKLLLLLRERGYGAIGTCRTDSGVLKEYILLKKEDIKKDQIP